MRDDDGGWETEGSDAEGVGKCGPECGDGTPTADVEQGVKRAAQVGAAERKVQPSVKRRRAVGTKSKESNKRESAVVISDEEEPVEEPKSRIARA